MKLCLIIVARGVVRNPLHDPEKVDQGQKLFLDVRENALRKNLTWDSICVKPYPIDYSAIKKIKENERNFG